MLEREIIADDLPRAANRKERRANGGGIGPFFKNYVKKAVLPAWELLVPESIPFIESGKALMKPFKKNGGDTGTSEALV